MQGMIYKPIYRGLATLNGGSILENSRIFTPKKTFSPRGELPGFNPVRLPPENDAVKVSISDGFRVKAESLRSSKLPTHQTTPVKNNAPAAEMMAAPNVPIAPKSVKEPETAVFKLTDVEDTGSKEAKPFVLQNSMPIYLVA
jgi:hypothetical protein